MEGPSLAAHIVPEGAIHNALEDLSSPSYSAVDTKFSITDGLGKKCTLVQQWWLSTVGNQLLADQSTSQEGIHVQNLVKAWGWGGS